MKNTQWVGLLSPFFLAVDLVLFKDLGQLRWMCGIRHVNLDGSYEHDHVTSSPTPADCHGLTLRAFDF